MLHDLSSHPWPVRPFRIDLASSFGCYALLAYVSIIIARQPDSIATIWLANGAAIALIASAPAQRRLWMLLAGAIGNLAANLLYGDDLVVSLAFLPPNAAEVALGAYLVHRTQCAERFANDHESLLRVLAAGAFVPPLLGATFGAVALQAFGFGVFADVWLDWYIGATLGSVALIPYVLALRGMSLRASLLRFANIGKLTSLVITSGVTVIALKYTPYPFVVIGVVLMVFAFVRPRLTTFANVLVVVATLAAALALGWYVPAGPQTQWGHTLVFASAMLVVVPAQVVSVVVARQRALSDMLAAVGSRIDDIIVFVDMQGIYRWVNQARELYWNTAKDQVLGRNWSENIGSEPYETIVRPLFEQARGGEVAQRMVEFEYPTKGRRVIDMLLQPARDEEGHQIGVLYCGTDVTELERSRRELQRVADELATANRNLEQFVRISSHDLREPLNTIVQFCDLIRAEQAPRLDDAGQLYFAQVRDGAARMKSMLDDVLQFVRLEDMSELSLDLIDLDSLARDVCAALAARILATGSQVTVAPLGTAMGHRSLLSLVLQNLLSNAIKFVPPGRVPVIEVVASRVDGELKVSVTDNGIGIDSHRIGELGTPFRRLHARRKYDGTGLGLAICKRIAQQLGGRIEITSQVGAGSCCSIVLPYQAAALK